VQYALLSSFSHSTSISHLLQQDKKKHNRHTHAGATVTPHNDTGTCQPTAGCIRTPGGCDICESGGSKCILCQQNIQNSCVTECYNATFSFSGNCKKECQQGLRETTGNTCAGVTHYVSQCTAGHQLGPPIGIVKELECTAYDFRLDNIHPQSLDHPICGEHKCFYRSRHDPKLGYVVVPYGEPGTDVHWLLTESYPYAARLAAKYHIRHGMVAPPRVIDLSEQSAKRILGSKSAKLNKRSNVWSEGSVPFQCGKRFWSYVVQRVEAAPGNARMLKFCCSKGNRPLGELAVFVREQTNETLLRTLQKDLFATRNMIAGEPSLAPDFQTMFAPDTGHLLQMDLDRGRATMFQKKTTSNRKIQQKIDVFLNGLLAKLKQRLVEIKQGNGA